MKKTLNAMLAVLLLSWLFMTATGCSDSDSNDSAESVPVTAQWGQTLKGNGEELGAYPDLYSNYWEYTYMIDENSDKIVCLKGQYPYCRYFSISLYNDETGSVTGGIDDYNIMPDAGCENPFTKTVTGTNTFTVYIVPPSVSESTIAQLGTANVCRVKEGIKRVAVCLRHYLGTDASGLQSHEFGGVALPVISAVDIRTLQPVDAPEHVTSNVYKVTSLVFAQKSDEDRLVPFFLAPEGLYYPNNSTSYLYGRTHLRQDSVLIFSFIPVTAPTKPEEYATANARYWSVCYGSGSDTRSYYSLCDRNALASPGKKSYFVVCLKNNPKLSQIQGQVDSLNQAGKLVNLTVWDSERLNIDGKPLGEIVVMMYRNILPNKNWQHSISNMLPTAYKDATGDPIDHVTQPERQLAHEALGDYGPLGEKVSTADFLAGKWK